MDLRKYSIEFDTKAAKEFEKLCKQNPPLSLRLSKAIDSLMFDPFNGKPLTGTKKGCFSLREGDYRIVYEIYSRHKTVFIIRVGHRRDVYR